MVERRVVYKGPYFVIEEWKEKTGSKFARVTGYDSVGILPILKNGKIILERQYRHSLDRYLYEIPAGKMEKGEDPALCAGRELEEETGYHAGRLRHMFDVYPSPGMKTELMHFYLADRLVKTKRHMDVDEIIEIKEVSIEKILSMMKTNQIRDGKTINGVLYYLHFMKK